MKFSTRFGNAMQWFKRSKKNKDVVIETEPVIDGGTDLEITDEFELPAKKEKLTRESTFTKLQEGYDQVVDLLGNVRNHMAEQADRSERLLTMLEGMPEAIKTLPEVTRNQTRTLEAIQGNLETQTHHNGRLADALDGMSRTTEQHEHAMSAIGQQLDAGQQTSERMLGSFTALGGTLNHMSASNEASADLLRQIAEQDSQAAEQVRELFLRNQKHMTTMSVVSWSLAIVALTVAGWVAVSITGMSPDNSNVTPVNNNTAAPTQIIPVDNNTPSATSAATSLAPADVTTVDLFDDHVSDPIGLIGTGETIEPIKIIEPVEPIELIDPSGDHNIQQAAPATETKTAVTSIFETESDD